MSLKINDMDPLQKEIFSKIQDQMIFDMYEEIIDHIFEHRDYSSTHLRSYTNAYLTNFGNIIICKTHHPDLTKIDDKSIGKEIIHNDYLDKEKVEILLHKDWTHITHPCNLKKELQDTLKMIIF